MNTCRKYQSFCLLMVILLVIEPLLIALGPVTPAYAALVAAGPAPSSRGQIVLDGPIGTHVNIFYTLNAYRKYTKSGPESIQIFRSL